MILLDSIDVLAIAARVLDVETETVLACADLDAIDEALAKARDTTATGDCAAVAGALLTGLVTRAPFPRSNRRIAMSVVVYLFATNGRQLELDSSADIDRMLDELEAGVAVRSAADWLRDHTQPSQPTQPAGAGSGRRTVRARHVLALARETAKQLQHPAVGTEHILVGLLAEANGVAARALRAAALSAELVRAQLEVLLGQGQEPVPDAAELPFTARAERLLELASEAAEELGHANVGTEHILLGLAKLGEGTAAEVLAKLGTVPAELGHQVFRILAGDEPSGATEPPDRQGGLSMFERFTDRSRRVVVLAQEEARMLQHNYIGTEHVLLGLIHEGEGIAARALRNLDISLNVARARIEEIVGQGQQAPSGHIPFTPRAKKVLELALREAMKLGVNYIGTEHLLLGLVREGEGVAAQVLAKVGVDLARVRQEVLDVLGHKSGEPGGQGRWSSLEEEWSRFHEGGFEDLPSSAVSGLHRRRTLREIEELYDLVDRLRLENDRLRGVLRAHDIDPGGPDVRPEDDEGLND